MLRFNASHVGDKYERLAAATGLEAGTDLAAFVEDLNARIGLPGSLREMGVPASSIPEMALKAERDHSTARRRLLPRCQRADRRLVDE